MKPTIRRFGIGVTALIATLTLGGRAHADVLDLTSNNASGFVNGGFFQETSPQPTGTGVIDPFLRLQATGTEQAYNTSAPPMQFDEKTDPNYTRNLMLSEIPKVIIGNTTYRQFLLDINESKSKELLSLDKLQIFQSPQGSLNNYPNLGTKVYDLDGNGDNSILLDYS